jgi:hypothetical protein
MAKDLVFEQALRLGVMDEYPDFNPGQVYVVWFSYVLGNNKALVSTSVPDGRYYEVTYAADVQKAFVDTYVKTHNYVVDIFFKKDEPAE